ncbi:MAG: penicillin-binding protein, partial [Verrucomicrobiae bacterium]|nr:penicillin-binding protein [Verrucomicrobiae bacterium]
MGKIKAILLWFAIAVGGTMLVAAFVLLAWLKPFYARAQEWDLGKLQEFQVTTVFYDRAGEEIGRLFVEDRILLSHQDIPDLMRHAVIAAEDRRFYSHHGIDWRGLGRAIRENLRARGVVQGGSTITQQLAKHLIGNFEKTLDRKILEAFLASRIERTYSKDEILDFYLNRIYFGRGYFGVGAAAQGYFGKKASELSVGECALLAGIIKAPSIRTPANGLEKSLRWRDLTLRKMESLNYVDAAQVEEAKATEIKLQPPAPSAKRGYFLAYAIKELDRVLGLDPDETPQGLRVNTTLDSGMQRLAETEVRRKLQEIETAAGPPSAGQDPLQAAALVMDLNSGAIRVYVGGRDFDSTPYDHISMARRENGALLQPFLYGLAFEQLGLHPASMINASFLDSGDLSNPEEVALGDPEKNIAKRFLTVQDALALSNKACATRVGLQLGMQKFTQWLGAAGVGRRGEEDAETFWDVKPLTLLEISSLYQALGNAGSRMRPFAIESVVNTHNEVIYRARQPASPPILKPLTAQQMTLTLQEVTRDGTASALTAAPRIRARFSTASARGTLLPPLRPLGDRAHGHRHGV